MNKEEIKKDFLERIVFRWMKNDIETMNQLNLNFPLALCTLSYIGFLGSILLGRDEFGKYKDGEEYIDKCFDNKIKIEYPIDVLRDVFRNPLAHEYFARGGISKEGGRPAIRKGNDGKIILDAKTLAQDFLESLSKFKILLEQDSEDKFTNRLVEMKYRLEEEENKHGYKFSMGLYATGSSSSTTVAGVYPISAVTELVSSLGIGIKIVNSKKDS